MQVNHCLRIPASCGWEDRTLSIHRICTSKIAWPVMAEVDEEPEAAMRQAQKLGGRYEWKASYDATFFPGRQVSSSFLMHCSKLASDSQIYVPHGCLLCDSQAAIFARGVEVGAFGIVHPGVLKNFDIPYPVAIVELNLEPFLYDQFGKVLSTHMGAMN